MKKLIILSIILLVQGCATMNDAMTPGVRVMQDDFDGSVTVSQRAVSASSSLLGEDWHSLGFYWNEKNPNTVSITVAIGGIQGISSVEFNVDGEFIKGTSGSGSGTDFEGLSNPYGSWSTRTFMLPIEKFRLVANGKVVKMKVSDYGTYTVSSFGTETPGAVVNTKFPPFLKAIDNALQDVASAL